MAWVSPKVYAILSSSEEGKDILEGIGEKSQDEVDKELDEFFGSGKGASKGADYQKAKAESKKATEDYDSYTDEEAKAAWEASKENNEEYKRKRESEGMTKPDEEYDEDYERSWGPKNDDEDDDGYKSLSNEELKDEFHKTEKLPDGEQKRRAMAAIQDEIANRVASENALPKNEWAKSNEADNRTEFQIDDDNYGWIDEENGKFTASYMANGDPFDTHSKEFGSKEEAQKYVEESLQSGKAKHGNWGITKQKSGKWRIDNTYDDYNSLEDAERALDADAIYGQQFTSYALTPGNKRTFLKENGLNGRYYFDGNNLIDKTTDEDTGIEIDPEKGWYDKEKFLEEVKRYEKHGVLPW